jgi:hypothetical protein
MVYVRTLRVVRGCWWQNLLRSTCDYPSSVQHTHAYVQSKPKEMAFPCWPISTGVCTRHVSRLACVSCMLDPHTMKDDHMSEPNHMGPTLLPPIPPLGCSPLCLSLSLSLSLSLCAKLHHRGCMQWSTTSRANSHLLSLLPWSVDANYPLLASSLPPPLLPNSKGHQRNLRFRWCGWWRRIEQALISICTSFIA